MPVRKAWKPLWNVSATLDTQLDGAALGNSLSLHVMERSGGHLENINAFWLSGVLSIVQSAKMADVSSANWGNF